MTTSIISSCDPLGMEKCVSEILAGGVVAFPTETVYGLGANALCAEAVEKIFEKKGRASDNPLIVHVDSVAMASEICYLSKDAALLMEAFCPGPLSLVLKKKDCIPHVVSANLPTVAVRLPGSEVARNLIGRCGVPIAAPSANKSGKISPTLAQHVLEDFNGELPFIIDGGACTVGLESTVIDVSGEIPTVLRQGGITLEMIQKILPKAKLHSGALKNDVTPPSPGMKYSHYCPTAPLTLVLGSDYNNIAACIKQHISRAPDTQPVVVCHQENLQNYDGFDTVTMGSREDLRSVAQSIFAALRKADGKLFGKKGTIYCEGVENADVGCAVLERLFKACSGNIIDTDDVSPMTDNL